MTGWFRRPNTRAFTLIELLVVIAIIAILAAILTPAVTAALLKAKVTDASTRARSMYQTLFLRQVDNVYMSSALPYPVKSNTLNATYMAFPDSTEFFRFVVTDGVMNVAFQYFALPGMPAARGKNPLEFKEENNGWCVTGGLTEKSPEDTPLFFTRNLDVDVLGLDKIVDEQGVMLARTPQTLLPFETKGFAFVTKGGSSYALVGESIKKEAFTNLFVASGATNIVLRPQP